MILTFPELLARLGTTNTSARFAKHYDIPQHVADYMFDKAWAINKIRDAVHTHKRPVSAWIRGGLTRDQYAIDLQRTATGLVKEMIDAARASK